MYKQIVQFIKFGFVGISNTLISIGIYYLLVYFKFNYIIANILGYIISSIWGYTLNSKWVFNQSDIKISKSVMRYYIVYGSSFLINILCMYIFVDILDISKIIAPILTMMVTVPYNFIFNKVWAFNNET
jgi:putative flippase GtrA